MLSVSSSFISLEASRENLSSVHGKSSVSFAVPDKLISKRQSLAKSSFAMNASLSHSQQHLLTDNSRSHSSSSVRFFSENEPVDNIINVLDADDAENMDAVSFREGDNSDINSIHSKSRSLKNLKKIKDDTTRPTDSNQKPNNTNSAPTSRPRTRHHSAIKKGLAGIDLPCPVCFLFIISFRE